MDWGAVPRHYRLRSALIQQIASGRWAVHQAIPSERELEQQFQVSRTTIRRALDDLTNMGYVYRDQGRGTFVAPAPETSAQAELLGFAEELQRSRMPAEIQVLAFRTEPADQVVAETLRLPPADPVIYLRRVVRSRGVPLLIVDSQLPAQLIGPELTAQLTQGTTIYQALELAGISIARGHQQLRAILLDEVTARDLGGRPGEPGLELTRVTYSLEGTPLEMSRGVYHGERYQYVIDLARNTGRRRPELH